jgi:hypothetical protein
MAEDRRKGLTIDQQLEMYAEVKENGRLIRKLHTIFIGNGVKGKIQEFEETDDELAASIKIVADGLNCLEKKFIRTLGPFIAVPGVLATILVIIGIIDKFWGKL